MASLVWFLHYHRASIEIFCFLLPLMFQEIPQKWTKFWNLQLCPRESDTSLFVPSILLQSNLEAYSLSATTYHHQCKAKESLSNLLVVVQGSLSVLYLDCGALAWSIAKGIIYGIQVFSWRNCFHTSIWLLEIFPPFLLWQTSLMEWNKLGLQFRCLR